MGSSLMNPTHLLVLAFVAFALFGAKRLPEMGRSLGLGMREFKNSVSDLRPEDPPQAEVASDASESTDN